MTAPYVLWLSSGCQGSISLGFSPQKRYLQALREETAAAQEAAPAAETCSYFTNLNLRTTSVVKAHFGSGAGTGGLSVVGRGQWVHHPQQPSVSITAFPKLWALLVHHPRGQGHRTGSIPAPVPWYPDSRSCLQPVPPRWVTQQQLLSLKNYSQSPSRWVLSPQHKGYAKSQLSTMQRWRGGRHQFKPTQQPQRRRRGTCWSPEEVEHTLHGGVTPCRTCVQSQLILTYTGARPSTVHSPILPGAAQEPGDTSPGQAARGSSTPLHIPACPELQWHSNQENNSDLPFAFNLMVFSRPFCRKDGKTRTPWRRERASEHVAIVQWSFDVWHVRQWHRHLHLPVKNIWVAIMEPDTSHAAEVLHQVGQRQ